MNKEGNCYAASEAVYHLLGGKASGWTPMRVPMGEGEENHWFLKHTSGLRIDLTKEQYAGKRGPDYSRAVGCGFLTSQPSRAARRLMDQLVWKRSGVNL